MRGNPEQVRELHDALKRRCLYHYIDYPDPEREMEIIKTKIPAINDYLAKKIAGIMAKLRDQEFYKRPGVSETIDWSQALTILEKEDVDEEVMDLTCGCLFKFKEDVKRFKDMKTEILIESKADPEE
ncbi:hypothetical protein [Desulfobacterium sp. N47]|uniref:hypothetical protein n=1 Tax=Desulfobacterium sp. N47 TaxID=3115210 RepID=UPI003CB1C3A5